MLTIDVIEGKPFFTNPQTSERYLDLLTPSWNTRTLRYTLKTIGIVTEETEMRADLVSFTYLNETSRLGTMLKLNNISNPLSLKSGEVLFIPGDDMVSELFRSGEAANNQKQKARSFRKELQEKISQVSKERLEYLNSKNISNIADTPLPPNLLREGEQQILVTE
jgi:hypothetical protein